MKDMVNAALFIASAIIGGLMAYGLTLF